MAGSRSRTIRVTSLSESREGASRLSPGNCSAYADKAVVSVRDKKVSVFIDPGLRLKTRHAYASPARTMGTPPASASLDQMRNVQRTASCGEEPIGSAAELK